MKSYRVKQKRGWRRKERGGGGQEGSTERRGKLNLQFLHRERRSSRRRDRGRSRKRREQKEEGAQTESGENGFGNRGSLEPDKRWGHIF